MRSAQEQTRLRVLLVTLAVVSLAGVIRATGVHKRPLPLPGRRPEASVPRIATPASTPALPRATPAAPRATPHPRAREVSAPPRWIATPGLDETRERYGRAPILVVFWESPAVLPYVERLHRRYGSGVFWVGAPVGNGLRAQEAVEWHRPQWRQLSTFSRNEEWRRALGASVDEAVLLAGGEVVYRGEAGAALEAALRSLHGGESRWGEDPIPREAGLALRYAGSTIARGLGEARLRVLDVFSGAETDVGVWIEPGASRLRIPVIAPGFYIAQVTIAGTSGRAAEAFHGRVDLLVADAPPRGDATAHLYRFIHLREPFDNAWIAPETKTPPFYSDPVDFVWSPVPDATRYEWRILGQPPVPWQTTTETRISVSLPPGRDWELQLGAWSGDHPVGRLRVAHDDVRNAERFRFRTRSY